MGSLRDRRRRHDVFFRKAREAGFAARSVFKLEDLDRRYTSVSNHMSRRYSVGRFFRTTPVSMSGATRSALSDRAA
jgi:hypothetical protein